MIAVPWRKFYRADFLRAHRLRFPEGDFFFEDNPFHWEVCLAAGSIAFHDRMLCQHRINRPGQTMASTGTELSAFFTHYDTIRASLRTTLPKEAAGLEVAALTWLLNNMSWHVDRLRPGAFWPYAARAARELAAVPDPIWQAVARAFSDRAIGQVAAALRQGDVAGIVGIWMQAAQRTEIAALRKRVEALGAGQAALAEGLPGALEHTERQLRALQEIQRFQALTALPGPKAEEEGRR